MHSSYTFSCSPGWSASAYTQNVSKAAVCMGQSLKDSGDQPGHEAGRHDEDGLKGWTDGIFRCEQYVDQLIEDQSFIWASVSLSYRRNASLIDVHTGRSADTPPRVASTSLSINLTLSADPLCPRSIASAIRGVKKSRTVLMGFSSGSAPSSNKGYCSASGISVVCKWHVPKGSQSLRVSLPPSAPLASPPRSLFSLPPMQRLVHDLATL
jgi:hypothetical protein